MKFRIEVVCVSEDGAEQRSEVTAIERQELAMETLGLNLADGKSILEGLQDFVVAQQTAEDLEQRRACPRCGRAHTSKGAGSDFSAHGVRDSAAAEPTLESVRLSVDRERDLSTAPELAAWANQS
jgi:hypothetical protein